MRQNSQSKNSTCSIFFNKANLLHCSSKPHPQNPERLTALIQTLTNLKSKNEVLFDIRQVFVGEGEISKQDVEKMLIQIHGEGYWEFIKEMWHTGIKKSQMFINMDTYFMKDTYLAAVQAVRTTLMAAQYISSQKNRKCFAMVRPPGHHSGLKSQPHGFSFFNNIAVAANYLISSKKAKNVAIVDWDVHHGQGTQKLFYNRKDVLFISLHRFDNGKFFPHIQESSSKNIGTGEGTGYNINVCWNLQQKPKGTIYKREQTCGDQQYCYAFNKIVVPVLQEFEPDYILISCGFDSAKGDPIGNLAITQAGYSMMLQKIMGLKTNILLVLQGGYNKQVLCWAGQSIIRTLTNTTPQSTNQAIKNLQKSQPNKFGMNGVQECINQISKYWSKI